MVVVLEKNMYLSEIYAELAAFFHGISFSLGGTTVRQTRAILIYLADIFLKLSEVS